ncbi:MAG: ribosome assembly cofactor RimP [Cyanobacteriota bacterium]|nr:ribosome assembly cofactor RimP [Cyanobacteriota bacterium]
MPHPLAPDLESLACPLAATAGLELRGLEVLTHRIPMTVQVLVQRKDGGDVSLDECAAFSGPLGEAIDAAGLLEAHHWVLEVSSPGIGERLQHDRDFNSFRGFPVEVLCRRPDGGEARHGGLLLSRDAEAVLLNVRGRIQRLPRDQVLEVRLVTSGADG